MASKAETEARDKVKELRRKYHGVTTWQSLCDVLDYLIDQHGPAKG